MGLLGMFQKIFGHLGAGDSEESASESSDLGGERWNADSWNIVLKAYCDGTDVSGIIVSREEGGFAADLDGIHAFLPDNLADVKPLSNPQDLVGRKLELRVMKLDHERKRAVVSRRDVLLHTSKADRDRFFQRLEEGQTVRGTVRTITDFGVFVDLGCVDGLIHLQDLSWKRISHPSETVGVGDVVEAKVLKVDRERAHVSLGLKQLQADPWESFVRRCRVGDRVKGRVTNIKVYGALLDIGDGVMGMLSGSEMSWINRKVHPCDVLKVGDDLEVQVIDIDKEKRRIKLSLKQCLPDPWWDLAAALSVGDRVSGIVRTIKDYGLFVRLDCGLEAFVHLSEISSTVPGEEAIQKYKKGDEVHAVITEINADLKRINLSIGQLDKVPS